MTNETSNDFELELLPEKLVIRFNKKPSVNATISKVIVGENRIVEPNNVLGMPTDPIAYYILASN